MNYHNITTDDMRNGEGLRVVLWVSGCSHYCKGCHNPITWDPDGGLPVTNETFGEILRELEKDYISGLTLTGGDPFYPSNIPTTKLLVVLKKVIPNKTIWIYTGYLWEDIIQNEELKSVMKWIDVIVDGEFIEDLADVRYPWAGSTNQRVIDVQKSLKEGKVVLYETR